MKNKIVMITAALAVMMAMTGIVAAYDLDIVKDVLFIPGTTIDSSDITYDGDVLLTGDQNFTLYTNNVNVMAKLCTNPCEDTPSTTSTGWVSGGYFNTNPGITVYTPKTASPPVRLYAMGNAVGTITIHINNGIYYCEGPTCTQVQQTATTSTRTDVPEFATVAIPIAAVLGLVFFFQQKKNKKE